MAPRQRQPHPGQLYGNAPAAGLEPNLNGEKREALLRREPRLIHSSKVQVGVAASSTIMPETPYFEIGDFISTSRMGKRNEAIPVGRPTWVELQISDSADWANTTTAPQALGYWLANLIMTNVDESGAAAIAQVRNVTAQMLTSEGRLRISLNDFLCAKVAIQLQNCDTSARTVRVRVEAWG